MLETILSIASDDVPLVFLEGDEGSGTTTTLRQIRNLKPNCTFSLFIRPASRVAYSSEYLKIELAEQFCIRLGIPVPDGDQLSAEYVRLMLRIRKLAKHAPIYFLIDGLHQIPIEDAIYIRDIVRDVLPLGFPNIRFIVTGDQAKLSIYFTQISSKPYRQLAFSLTDTRTFLQGIVAEERIEEVHNLCKHIPGRLAAVRRLIVDGLSLDEIYTEAPKILHFVALEFRKLDDLDAEQKLIIALLAYGRQPLTAKDLSLILGYGADEVLNTLQTCMFIDQGSITEQVSFLSEGHRRYAENLLGSVRRKAIQLLIDHFQKHPTTPSAVRFLPTYLQQLNQGEALLSQLSNDHFSALLEHTSSSLTLRTHAEIGIANSIALSKFTEALKYTLHKSIFTAYARDQGLPSEVGALVALGHPDLALSIASQASAIESRVALLAAYARGLKRTTGSVDQTILEYLRDTAPRLDLSELPDLAADIAANLVLVDPDLAMAVVEKANRSESSSSARDQALARMSLIASLSGASDNRRIEEDARRKIKDEKLRSVVDSLVALFADSSSTRIRAVAERMEPRHRLFFLRSVVTYKPKRQGVLDLVEYALETMIADATYVPTAADLADLARPLHFSDQDVDRVATLVARLDSQIGLVKEASKTKDLVILQMRLARAELKFDRSKSYDRILQCYCSVGERASVEARAEGYALMLRFMNSIDVDGDLEKQHGYRTAVQADLTHTLTEILANTSDHFMVAQGAIAAICTFDVQQALSLAKMLNTEAARTKAYSLIATTLLTRRHSAAVESAFKAALRAISDPVERDNALLSCASALKRNSDASSWRDCTLDAFCTMHDPLKSCNADIRWHEAFGSAFDAASLQKFVERLDSRVPRLASDIDAADVLFKAAQLVAKHSPADARRMYDSGSVLRQRRQYASHSSEQILISAVVLTMRASAKLICHGFFSEDHLARLSLLIESVPNIQGRAELYATLAAWAWCFEGRDLCRKILQEFCVPILDWDADKNARTRPVLEAILPILSLALPATANAGAAALYPARRDYALTQSILILLRRLPDTEPFSSEFVNFQNSREDILEAIEILEKIEIDSCSYWCIEWIVKALLSEPNKVRITRQQRSNFADRLREIAASRFPDMKNIQHNGYTIAAKAQYTRLLNVGDQVWLDLLNEADTVSNLSDRVYVKLEIIRCLPSKAQFQKPKLMEKLLAEIENVPSTYDRSVLFELVARVASVEAKSMVAPALKRAMLCSHDIGDSDAASRHRRELIDIADRVRDGLAEELAEMIDDDPARARMKAQMRSDLEVSKARKSLSNSGQIVLDSKAKQHLSQAAWQSFELLVNRRLVHRRMEEMTSILQAAGHFGVNEVYPIIAWYIENANQRFSTKEDVAREVAPLFEALLVSTEVASAVCLRRAATLAKSLDVNEPNRVVEPRTRSQSLEFVANWLRENSKGFVLLCDPYFSRKDIGFFAAVAAEAPETTIKVLCSRMWLKKTGSVQEAFEDAWRAEFEQPPPEIEIVAIGREGDEGLLIHDRWILTEGAGLRLGTSWSSIGESKLTEISAMEPAEVATVLDSIRPFVDHQRVVHGDRVSYMTVVL